MGVSAVAPVPLQDLDLVAVGILDEKKRASSALRAAKSTMFAA